MQKVLRFSNSLRKVKSTTSTGPCDQILMDKIEFFQKNSHFQGFYLFYQISVYDV